MFRFWASGGGEAGDLTAPLVRDGRRVQSEPLVESGDSELLALVSLSKPAPGSGGGRPSTRLCFVGGFRHGVPAEFLHEEERGEGEEHPGGGEMQVGRGWWDSKCPALLPCSSSAVGEEF